MKYVFKIIVTSFAVVIVSYLLSDGIHVQNYTTAIFVAIVLSLLNIFLKPLLILLTIPATIFSLGLFLLVLNAFIILLTDSMVDGFTVDSFGWAFAFSIMLSVVTFLLELPDRIKSKKIIIKKTNYEQ
jgi:putative membrane protein